MTSHSEAWSAVLADELRAEMARQNNMTMEELAKASGIPKVSIERYVNGKREIPMNRFHEICRALGVSEALMISRVVSETSRRRGETEPPSQTG